MKYIFLEHNLKITYNKSKSYTVRIDGQDETYQVEGFLKRDPADRIALVTHFTDTVTKCKLFFQGEFVHVFTQVII